MDSVLLAFNTCGTSKFSINEWINQSYKISYFAPISYSKPKYRIHCCKIQPTSFKLPHHKEVQENYAAVDSLGLGAKSCVLNYLASGKLRLNLSALGLSIDKYSWQNLSQLHLQLSAHQLDLLLLLQGFPLDLVSGNIEGIQGFNKWKICKQIN